MSIFSKFFFTIFGSSILAWLRDFISRVTGDGGTLSDQGHTKDVYTDTYPYGPTLIQTCDSGGSTAQNFAVGSEDISNATYWFISNVTAASISELNPFGVSSGVTLVAEITETGGVTTAKGFYQQPAYQATVVSGQAYTVSAYVKKGDGSLAPDIIQITYYSTNFGQNFYANYNISTGVVTKVSGGFADIEDVGGGWYRISLAGVATSSGSSGTFVFAFANNDPNAIRFPSYTGDVNRDVYIWGVQFVQGNEPGEYIKTTTAAIDSIGTLYSAAIFDDVDDFELRIVADGGTNVSTRQNALVAQHLWRNELHNNASLVVPCASYRAGRLYAYQPTVEPQALLETYTGSAAAYSLRSLSASTTNVVKVRRSGDNAELDFTATEVSDGTLTSWVTAGGGTENGHVTTWYDQSGNGNNATQATAAYQPKIVSAGSLVTENGRAAIEGSANGRLQTSDIVLSSDLTMVAVASFDRSGLSSMLFGGTATATRSYFWRNNISTIKIVNINENGFASFTVLFGTQDLFFARREGTTVGLSVNGTETTLTEQATQGVDFTINKIGGGYNVFYDFDGRYQEMIFWNTSQSANRTGIEDNINDYYNIYP